MQGTESPKEYLIQLEGIVGFSVACELRSIVLNAATGIKPVVIDCAKVERFDASALQILHGLAVQLHEAGRTFRIDHASHTIVHYARMAGFGPLFEGHGA